MNTSISVRSFHHVFRNILRSRQITRQDQQVLMALVHGGGSSDVDLSLVNQVHDELKRGFLRVVD